ncbi:MAG: hypothetical protein FH762_03810 [Firmicutes bacterium]|nr:hypothetical protein [Bacillota bacterium]
MGFIGELVKEEIDKTPGMDEDKLSNLLGLEQLEFLEYINGDRILPDELLIEIAVILDSSLLQCFVAGAIAGFMSFNQDKADFYITAKNSINHFEKTMGLTKRVLRFIHNKNSIADLSREEVMIYRQMINMLRDTGHFCKMLQLAVEKMDKNFSNETGNKSSNIDYISNKFKNYKAAAGILCAVDKK